jgi:hypothetical protein
MSPAVSNAANAGTKKRTHEELGNHDDDDDDSDKKTFSGLAAFLHYAQANHKQVLSALSENAKAKANVTFGKVAEELANNYKALSAAEIAKWQEIAVTSDVNFVKEMKPYSEPTRMTKKKKDPDAPKGPVSAYFHYMMAIRSTILADDPDLAFGDVTKECAARFKAMTDEAKKEWIDKAAADKIRYKEQLEVYEKEQDKTQENAGNQKKDDDHEKADKPNKKKKAKKTHDVEKTLDNKPKELKEETLKEADKPKKKNKKRENEDDHAKAEKPKKEKRAADAPKWYKSGYALYMEANRETIQKANPDVSNSEVSKLGSTNFKALPDKEQQKWTDKAAADKARFNQEMEVYNSKQEASKK